MENADPTARHDLEEFATAPSRGRGSAGSPSSIGLRGGGATCSARTSFRVELQRPLWHRDRARNRWLAGLAGGLGVPCVATGNAHAHARSRLPLQDALVAVRLRATLDETEGVRRGNSSAFLFSAPDAAERFRDHPDAVAESERLFADRLRFDLTRDLGYSYPGAEDETADRRLGELCRARLERRYPPTAGDRAEAERRLEEELGLVRRLRLSGFFLLHQDMLELAREVALEVRGAEFRASPAPSRPRARLQRQLDRLLSDRPVAHRPGRKRPLLGPLPERGADRRS